MLLEEQEVTVTIDRNYTPCLTTQPGVTSGQSSRTLTVTTGCLNPGEAHPGVKTITWNTGQTSTFSYSATSSHVGGQAVLIRTGAITSGLFSGSTVESIEPIVTPTSPPA